MAPSVASGGPPTPSATPTANPLEPSPTSQRTRVVSPSSAWTCCVGVKLTPRVLQHKRSATGFIPTEGEPQLKGQLVLSP